MLKHTSNTTLLLGIALALCLPGSIGANEPAAVSTNAASPTPTPSSTPRPSSEPSALPTPETSASAPMPSPEASLPVAAVTAIPQPSPAPKPSVSVPKAEPKPEQKPETKSVRTEERDPLIIQIRDQLKKRPKNTRLTKLGRAYESLEAGKTSSAAKLASPMKDDPLYGDYALWILGLSHLQDARSAIQRNKNQEAITLARKSLQHFGELALEHPYSAIQKMLPRDVGHAELVIARASCTVKSVKSPSKPSSKSKKKKPAAAAATRWDPCKRRFENAFQRLSSVNELGSIRPEEIALYASACNDAPSDLCQGWIRRFRSYFPKNTAEAKSLVKLIPSASEKLPKPPAYGRATQTYRGPELDQVAMDEAMGHYNEQRFSEAIKSFRRLLDDFPKSAHRYRARYWMIRALIREKADEAQLRKNWDELQKDNPLGWFGLLAALETKTPLESMIQQSVPQVADTDANLNPVELLRLERAKSFIAMGAKDLASVELRDFKGRDGLSNPFLMYLTYLNGEVGNHSTVFSLITDLIQRNFPGVLSANVIPVIFPIAHYDLIKKYATEYKIDPILLISQMKQESAFDRHATSHVGAKGLMQLMPSTASDVAAEVVRADLALPDPNVRIGAKYLKQMLNRYSGNIVYALAAYNAGPGAVNRWIRAAEAKPGKQMGIVEFIDSIPFKETREYVATIIRNHYWYSKRLAAGEPLKDLSYFWGPQAPKLESQDPPAEETPETEE